MNLRSLFLKLHVSADDVAFSEVAADFAELVPEALAFGQDSAERVEADAVSFFPEVALAVDFGPADADEVRFAVLLSGDDVGVEL